MNFHRSRLVNRLWPHEVWTKSGNFILLISLSVNQIPMAAFRRRRRRKNHSKWFVLRISFPFIFPKFFYVSQNWNISRGKCFAKGMNMRFQRNEYDFLDKAIHRCAIVCIKYTYTPTPTLDFPFRNASSNRRIHFS